MAGHVFISYSRPDRRYVDALAAELQRRGIACWYDRRIGPGDRWDNEIEQQVDACACMIVVMSRDSRESHWVAVEAQAAQQRNRPIFPLLLSGEPFMRFNVVQHDDVRGGHLPDEDFYHRITDAVSGRRRPQVAPPGVPAPPRPPRRPVDTRRQGPTGVLVGVLLVLALCAGAAFWGGSAVWSAVRGSLPFGGSDVSDEPERLAQQSSTTFGGATFLVTSVKSNGSLIRITVVADNTDGSQNLEIWSWPGLVQNPSGKTRQADPHESDFPTSPQSPIGSGQRISGDLIFRGGGLEPGTTSVSINFTAKASGPQEMRDLQIAGVPLV